MTVTYREQVARLLALQPAPAGPVILFPQHEVAGELERVFTCQGCGSQVAVGPCFEDIVDGGFVCGGCLEDKAAA